MNRKQVLVLVTLVVFVVLGIMAGIFARGKKLEGGIIAYPNSPKEGGEVSSSQLYYSSEVPRNAVLTPTKNEAPASANSELDSKARFFDMNASRSGFSPSTITVNKGDTLYIDFTATDGAYDLDIPYLGAYFTKVDQSKTKRLPFDVSLSGTFVFECRDYCPRGGAIQGSLVVLP